jgi:hypothetical protein
MAGLFDGLKNLYQQNIPSEKRMYGESLVKSVTGQNQQPQTESNFTSTELQTLKQFLDNVYQKKVEYFSRPKAELLKEASQLEQQAAKFKNDKNTEVSVTGLLNQAQHLRKAADGVLPSDFSVSYKDFMNLYPKNTNVNWNDTLGQFRFKVDNKGNYQVYDTYDFDNPSRSASVQRYAEMNPLTRFASSVSSFLKGNESALGEAYLGKNQGVPVNINIQNPNYQDPFGDTTK